MTVLVPALVVIVEDLVVVRVDEHCLEIRFTHIVVESVERLEAVRYDQGQAGLGSGTLRCPGVSCGPISVIPILPGSAEELIVDIRCRFIEECEHSNDLPIVRIRVFTGQRFDHLFRSKDVLGIGSPIGITSMTRVVVAVLTARSAMQVQDDFDVVFPCPTYRPVEILRRSLDEGLSTGDIVRPVPDRYTDMVQASFWDTLATCGTG